MRQSVAFGRKVRAAIAARRTLGCFRTAAATSTAPAAPSAPTPFIGCIGLRRLGRDAVYGDQRTDRRNRRRRPDVFRKRHALGGFGHGRLVFVDSLLLRPAALFSLAVVAVRLLRQRFGPYLAVGRGRGRAALVTPLLLVLDSALTVPLAVAPLVAPAIASIVTATTIAFAACTPSIAAFAVGADFRRFNRRSWNRDRCRIDSQGRWPDC